MIRIYDKVDNSSLGTISEEQLDFLIENLEEESSKDQDYFIDQSTIDMLVEKGMDSALLEFLRKSLGKRESMEIVWEDV